MVTGNWGGVRDWLTERGLNLSLGYVNEWLHNVSGGARSASAYADQIAFAADLDLDQTTGWSGGSVHLLITNRNGPQLDAKAGLGTLLETHEIYGRGHYTRLTRFYLQQDLLDDRVTLKIGRSDVDFFPLSCEFINISFCGALPGYHSNGWYTWPIGQYFANVTVHPQRTAYLKIGATDVNPLNLEGEQGLRLRTPDHHPRGTLSNLEAGWLPTFNASLPGAYRIGYWRDSTDYPDLFLNDEGVPLPIGEGMPRMHESSKGFYALAQQRVTARGEAGGLVVFANWSQSDSEVNKVDRLVSLGLWYTGPFTSRPRDRLGVAIGFNRVGRQFRQFERLSNELSGVRAAPLGTEVPIEFNFSIVGPRGLAVMPSVQYVRHPGGRSEADDVWIVGAKVSAQF
jgi:porin